MNRRQNASAMAWSSNEGNRMRRRGADCVSAHLCFLPPPLPHLPPNNLAPRCRRRVAEQFQDGGRRGGTFDRTIGVIDRLVA
jgi:hypothetical protein